MRPARRDGRQAADRARERGHVRDSRETSPTARRASSAIWSLADLPAVRADVATSLARRADARLPPPPSERADPGSRRALRHETAYENLVNAEAAKFEEERTPSSAELERTSEGCGHVRRVHRRLPRAKTPPRLGRCVVPRLQALRDLATLRRPHGALRP